MVSESNTNRRHLKISNTHDQIHYNIPHNILAMISSFSSGILIWTSSLNIQTIYFGLYVFQSVVTVMQLAITILPSTGLPVII